MANLGTASPPSLPPTSSLPDPAPPILTDEEDCIRRLNSSLVSQDEAFIEKSISDRKKRMLALRRKLGKNVESSRRKPSTCWVCLKPEHPHGVRCPLMRSAKEDSVVGPGWMIICSCCFKENSHPGKKKGVHRFATRRFCGNCMTNGHCSDTCTNPPSLFKISSSYYHLYRK
ncbi:hypothetical protein OROHE_022823 [Orobanche hederae]